MIKRFSLVKSKTVDAVLVTVIIGLLLASSFLFLSHAVQQTHVPQHYDAYVSTSVPAPITGPAGSAPTPTDTNSTGT